MQTDGRTSMTRLVVASVALSCARSYQVDARTRRKPSDNYSHNSPLQQLRVFFPIQTTEPVTGKIVSPGAASKQRSNSRYSFGNIADSIGTIFRNKVSKSGRTHRFTLLLTFFHSSFI